MGRFENKIVVVTGAAKGLGKAIAEQFYKEDAQLVVLLDLDEAMVKATAEEIDAEGKRTFAAACNVADPESVKEAFDRIYEKTDRVDILVNNAGITRDALVHKMSNEQFDMVLKVSLYGTFYCSKQVIDGMRERNYGRIINMSSLAHRGNVGQANYSAAKAGIIGLTKTMAMELGRKNITVNCISPSLVNTDIIKTMPEDVKKGMIKAVPVQRIAEPEEVAELAAYLASDEAGYISGQCIKITGGWW